MSAILAPRPAAKFISENSRFVSINNEGVKNLSRKLFECMKKNEYSIKNWREQELHPHVADERALDWIFFADTLNFSFWPDEGASEKFRCKYKGKEYTGYWSLCAAMNKALDGGVALTDPTYYSKVNVTTLELLFRGCNDQLLPLMEERTRILNETGEILIQKFGGKFINCVKQADGSAVKLLKLIVDNFPSYRDHATFHGKQVALYKRAQILVGDVWACFQNEAPAHFPDIDEITMFADYRIPQALSYFNVLQYNDQLMEKLKRGELLENGGEEEVEIRGNSIWGVELVAEELKKLMKIETENDVISYSPMNSILIDHYLWDYRRQFAQEMEHIPFHKTRCIYY